LYSGYRLCGIKKKDTVRTMLRIDKNLNFQNIFGTSRPSFSSVQLFNTQVLSYDGDEDLTRLFAFGTPLNEHSTILTMFTVLNYKNDTINPGFAVGFDLSNGGGFAIPSVSTSCSATSGSPRLKPTFSGTAARPIASNSAPANRSCSATSAAPASSCFRYPSVLI
jgi:hypothetical protein